MTYFFAPEPRKGNRHVWDIKAVKRTLGPDICGNILFVHAISGCDTTSRLFGIGKGSVLKNLQADHDFSEQVQTFSQPLLTKDAMAAAGEKALVLLYNGKPGDTLGQLRYRRFLEKSATATVHIG